MLPRPTVFLVHGEGDDPETLDEHGGPTFQLQNPASGQGTTGLPSKTNVFSQDLRIWVYDRDDMTIRVEVATGSLDELLLKPLYCPGGGGGSRADMASRADLTSRADMAMRHHYR